MHEHDAWFWQQLLAAEASPQKSRDLAAELGSSLFGLDVDLARHSALNAPERKRVSMASRTVLATVLQSGTEILLETDYPEPLRHAQQFVSPALFIHGSKEAISAPTVGIVGTRNASPYGRACAQKFAERLASRGVTIVSGGALGIDAAAHRGALAADGATVAVLAGGIDHVYPSVHAALFRQLCRKGCLISQFAAGFRPLDYKFLARNVTVAALSRVLLVIEAPTRSGALSTAHAAVEMGREVFVVPANIDAEGFKGSFNLLRDGAGVCYHPDQILEALGLPSESVTEQGKPEASSSPIVSLLGLTPIDAEKISQATGLPSSEILAELTMLELDGIVTREAGGYVLKR